MKILYLEAKKKSLSRINLDVSELPSELFLAYSIQYKATAEEIRRKLIESGIRVKGFMQVLGCTKLETKLPILLVGSGRFHALNLALRNNTAIYIYSEDRLIKIEEKDILELKKKNEGAFNRFLHAGKIGILVTLKAGQENMKSAEELKKKIEKKYPGKSVFIFLASNVNTAELENFDIEFWINTACPGLSYDTPKLINIDAISEFIG
jgi:diphthamide biosynthesis enzyme Dph1/Dph2-like protein